MTALNNEFYPEIEIDDAGWGDLIGGVIIGGYNPLLAEFRWEEVPVEHFQGESFIKKTYLDATKRAVYKILGNLRAEKKFYRIALCTGYVLTDAVRSLRKKGWRIVRRKIEGRCQELVEERNRKELIKLGVPPSTIGNIPPSANRFIRLFEWVKENPKERERYVKTGWKSWQSKWKPKLWEK